MVGAGFKPALSVYNPIPTPTATRHFKDFGPLAARPDLVQITTELRLSICISSSEKKNLPLPNESILETS